MLALNELCFFCFLKNMAPGDEPLQHFSLPTPYIKSEFIERNMPRVTQSGRYHEESDHSHRSRSFMFLTYLCDLAFRAVVSPLTCEDAN